MLAVLTWVVLSCRPLEWCCHADRLSGVVMQTAWVVLLCRPLEWCCHADRFLNCLASFHVPYLAVCAPKLQFFPFFLSWNGEYFCLAICRVTQLSNFYLLTYDFVVRLHPNLEFRHFCSSWHDWSCDSYCHLLRLFVIDLVFLLSYLRYICDQ